ncbi:WD repeat protein [Aspergillus luchuensis]|uniref:WD repeat protein n=1 Tax=Aspergillus kawachii TaxID=1069201 RepID=A0A146F9G5_ASPKA|nr:WD repeat protein [Aspergillus luchuensis]
MDTATDDPNQDSFELHNRAENEPLVCARWTEEEDASHLVNFAPEERFCVLLLQVIMAPLAALHITRTFGLSQRHARDMDTVNAGAE